MRPAAEGEMLVRLPFDVEAVGVREHRRIAVGGGEHAPHLGVTGDRRPVERDVGVQHACREDDRAVVAETLLDGALGELRPRAELRQLGGMLEERPDAVADQADRRLEAGDEEADRLRDELGWAQAVALLLGPDEGAQEIVAEARPPRRDQLLEVRGERHPGGSGLREHLGRQHAGREAVRRLRRPRGEAVAVAHRDAEHLADDGGGHRQREVGDHVHLAARGHPVEALVDDALDVAAQCGDRPRREGAAHETTETGVRRRILLEHELALPAERLVDAGQDAVRGARAGGHLVQQPVDVGVAREAPEADRREVHRLDFAQPAEARVRIVAERRIERVTAAPRIVRAHRAASLCAGIT